MVTAIKTPLPGSPELRALRQAERERMRLIDAGLIPIKYLPRPCTVRILMLVDDGISYNQFYFGLSEVLDTLRGAPEWWVRFDITRAHRHTDPNPPATPAGMALYGPHLQNFHFNQAGFDIDTFDEVWFYGFNSGAGTPGTCAPLTGIPPNALTDAELAVLYRWMNERDGGVFATGDHANLGEALCSRIPRVRSMRKWAFNPVGDPVNSAPNNTGVNRHDTLVPGHDRADTANDEAAQYTFDDESDDLPMPLRLRWYALRYQCRVGFKLLHPGWYRFPRVPHPLLCGKAGPITAFPDHPHEGEVRVPTALGDTPAFCAYSAREYPDLGASPLSPQIVAWARVRDDHKVGDFKGSVNAKEFGVVGAYDGHCVGVGRVVVDSTWHHWFDVNLTGRMVLFDDAPGNIETGDARKQKGFLDTPAGVAALGRIRNYFRNVALWLAPPARQRCMACKALWGAIHRFPLKADLRADMPIEEIGHQAWQVLVKMAGRCQVQGWWEVLVDHPRLNKLFDLDRYDAPPELLQRIDEYMLGAVLRDLLVLRAQLPEGTHPSDDDLQKHALRAVESGFKALADEVGRGQKALQDLQDSLT
jgi:hypothetical protein